MTHQVLRVEQAENPTVLWSQAARALLKILAARQGEGAVPCIVLTGGSGGEGILAALAEHARRDTVDWTRVRFLWGDERWTPAGHDDRNDKLADDTLFARVEVDPALVHRVPAADSGLTLDEAAAAYAAVVSRIDRIDVAINGVGPDGHVASLFPGRAEIDLVEPGTPAAMPIRDSPKPPPERVTLTLPALNSADRVWLLAAGAGKREVVGRILACDQNPAKRLPAARLAGRIDTVLWGDDAALVD